MYELLKKRIIKKTFDTKENMQNMLDVYYLKNRIDQTQYNELTELLGNVEVDINIMKKEKINLTKNKLEEFLETHPMQFTRDNSQIGLYAITSEKQQYLASEIQTATICKQNDIDYQLSWNCTGEVCTNDYTLEELCRLSLEIKIYIKPKIAYQQLLETQIINATNSKEIENIVINYEG